MVAEFCQPLYLVTEKFLENIHTMLNEPSVGLYRVQEHVRRSLPQLVDKKVLIFMLWFKFFLS